jgi:hypothetical protein
VWGPGDEETTSFDIPEAARASRAAQVACSRQPTYGARYSMFGLEGGMSAAGTGFVAGSCRGVATSRAAKTCQDLLGTFLCLCEQKSRLGVRLRLLTEETPTSLLFARCFTGG